MYDLNMTKFVWKFTTRMMVLACVLCHEDAFNNYCPYLAEKDDQMLQDEERNSNWTTYKRILYQPTNLPNYIGNLTPQFSLSSSTSYINTNSCRAHLAWLELSRRVVWLEMFEEPYSLLTKRSSRQLSATAEIEASN